MLPEDWSYKAERMELICPHGVGHPVTSNPKQSHGCDGCCSNEEFEKANKKILEKSKQE